MKSLQIFKPGRHTAMSGATLEFTESDLKASAEAYDPALHEAPIVVGHPKTDDPAYGWIKSLGFAEGKLEAEPHQVDTHFAELVATGRYKKISASFYAPDSPNNPKPGVYYLRHVGFLGAQPPAVKGLKTASFADSEQGVVEFSDWTMRTNASLWRRMRDWIISQSGIETANQVIPDYEITTLEESALKDEPRPAFTEPTEEEKQNMLTKEQLDKQAQELADREAKIKADEAAFAERETRVKVAEEKQRAEAAAARRTTITTRIDAVVAAGRLLPKDKDAAIAFAAALPEDGTIEFGEGDKKVSQPAGDWFLSFVEGLPVQVDLKERGKGGAEQLDTTDSKAIADRALAYQEEERKAGREISLTAAVQHVTEGVKK